jgi:hypothetical protein
MITGSGGDSGNQLLTADREQYTDLRVSRFPID